MVQFEPKLEWISECYPELNIDSLATWSEDNKIIIFITSKNTNEILILYGENIKYPYTFGSIGFGQYGTNLGDFNRPNGISVINNILFVVERDNHRVQVFEIPSLKLLGSFGSNVLIAPYGICSIEKKEEEYNYSIFVTDDATKEILNFLVNIKNSNIMNVKYKSIIKSNKLVKLGRIESIHPDVEYERLLIADELEKNIKIFKLTENLEWKYERTIGNNIFSGEPEGITLIQTDEKNGIYITTDQSIENNKFHMWNREDLKYLGYFSNPEIQNTDGICITQNDYNSGKFYAVHNDCAIACINIKDILAGLNNKSNYIKPLIGVGLAALATLTTFLIK